MIWMRITILRTLGLIVALTAPSQSPADEVAGTAREAHQQRRDNPTPPCFYVLCYGSYHYSFASTNLRSDFTSAVVNALNLPSVKPRSVRLPIRTRFRRRTGCFRRRSISRI